MPTSTIGGANIPTPPDWAYSTVSKFRANYAPPIPNLTTLQSVEALVEGSEMSMLREGTSLTTMFIACLVDTHTGSPMTPEYAWTHREGRRTRYEGNRVGGTVVVHFIKKNMWFLETALALLEGVEQSESEQFHSGRLDDDAPSLATQSQRIITKHWQR